MDALFYKIPFLSQGRQIFADVTGYPVVCPIYDVEANMGDVMLAGIGTGLLTYEEVKKWQVLDEKIMPNEENHKKYNEYFRLYKSIYEAGPGFSSTSMLRMSGYYMRN